MHILALAETGATDAQISKQVGIPLSTLSSWKKQHPSFLEALKASKDVADDMVEIALFQRACGYKHKAVKHFFDSKWGEIHTVKYIEHYPPDTTACIFWLKNRRRDDWRDVHRQEVAVAEGEGPQLIITLPSNGREAKK